MANLGLNELAEVCKLISKLKFPGQGAKVREVARKKYTSLGNHAVDRP